MASNVPHNNPDQICKYQTSKTLIEFRDRLQAAPAEQASNLHSPFSKINVVAMDYSNKEEGTVIVEVNLDPEVLKYIANELLLGKQFAWEQQKVLHRRTNNAGECRTTKMSIKFQAELSNPWIIVVENGWGKAEKQPNGGIALAKGTYRKEKQVRVFLTEQAIKQLFLQVRDYLMAWECVVMGDLVHNRKRATANEEE